MDRDGAVSFPGGYEDRKEEFIDVGELDKMATSFGPMREDIAPEPRGRVLAEAINIINGERQDVYGSPEDSFALIARYWQTYLESRPGLMTFMGAKPDHADPLGSEDVALMMVLFKIAREANQHKRDNIIDAAGYLGIYADMQGDE